MENRSHPTAAARMRSDEVTAPPAVSASSPAQSRPFPRCRKNRHIINWTPQEDALLRDQVEIHGTDSWTNIASQFNNKTGRQCRRRWYTCLNSECKKGGWSPEEDMILCEAQKIYGNRWTEIAKVVSGRTDNAVKNRFSTLCKKWAKNEDLLKENGGNKRAVTQKGRFDDALRETLVPPKRIRRQSSDLIENLKPNERLLRKHGMHEGQIRPPLAVLAQNFDSVGGLQDQVLVRNNPEEVHAGSNNMIQTTFLKRDDPKLAALLKQADLLSSLADKVNSGDTSQCLEDAWKELQDYLMQNEESGSLRRKIFEMDFLVDDLTDLIKDLKSVNTGSLPQWRETNVNDESQGTSGSIQCSSIKRNKKPQQQIEVCSLNQHAEVNSSGEYFPPVSSDFGKAAVQSACEEPKENDGTICTLQNSEFSSPPQTMPLFRSLADGIPSPKFSSSERRFLLSVLSLSSPVSSPNSVQQPSCKKTLLDRL